MKTYKPAPSVGWIWPAALSLILFLAPLPTWTVILGPALVMTLIMWPIALYLGLTAWWFPSMRYELSPAELVLCYGPSRYPIPLAAIQSVSRRNLRLSLWSSMRFPGLAVWTVPYGGVGNVFMMASRSLTDILLIEANGKRYGITPADEAGFLADLERMRVAG